MAFVIDFQAFKSPDNEFILKELAILSIEDDSEFHVIFKPIQPYSTLPPEMRKQVSYLHRHVHGIRWDVGTVDYNAIIDSIKESLLKDASIIFIKGLERAKFIRNLLEGKVVVENLDDYAVGYKSSGADVCGHHSRDCGRCSLGKARDFKNWMIHHGYFWM